VAPPRQVTCARKRGEHLEPHERISHLGGDGWIVAEDRAIATVNADLNAFYLETATGTEYLVARIHRGREYLTIESEELIPTSLLSLSGCRRPRSHYD
jgi:hypothetical protein